MAKKKRSKKIVLFKTPEEVAEHLASLDGESDYETEARVAGQIARLGARLIKSIKAEELKNPRMCALSCGLVSMFLLRLADVPEDEHEDFFVLLMKEYKELDKWMFDTESGTVH